ncbi:nuclear polyadenylated RNA-binding protein 3 [Cocos nucifera]|uniref:Nuclear polyadenylated RNA-binding protein 3 n=1 Tax=Cocos nucifera TaxID=13894 RepID=A0A8K0N388_COCNU|nr:nuclear polyadenylated RNA-binding protein 3 [Cocos nucifera]
MGDEDFEEEEVWAAVREAKDESPKTRRTKDFTGSSTSRLLPTPSKMIPRSNANPESSGGAFRQSAPVAIPDWSKIYKHEGSSQGHGYRFYGDDAGHNSGKNTVANDDDDEDDDDDDKVPPHEWLAKKMARSQISCFSVCEGAGRTLKGRDLSKVRNAVLTRTGFLERGETAWEH